MDNKYEQFSEKELDVLFATRIEELSTQLRWLASQTTEEAFTYFDRCKSLSSSYCRKYHGLARHNGRWQVANLIDRIDDCQRTLDDLGLILEAGNGSEGDRDDS